MAEFVQTNRGGKALHYMRVTCTIKSERARMKMSVYESGAKEPSRRRKVRERERRIQTLFQRFNGGNISIDEYLESFKHHTGLYTSFFFVVTVA